MTERSQRQAGNRSTAAYRNLIDAPTDDDLLKFEPTVQALAKSILETIGPEASPTQSRGYGLTIGVYGEWGSGKTSFLKMVEKNIKSLYLRETLAQEIRKQGKGQPLNNGEVRRQVERKLQQMSEKERKKLEEEGITPVWFEAWRYDREENLWAALLQTILNRISDQSTWYRRARAKTRIWWKDLRFRDGTWGVLKQLLLFVLRLLLIAGSIYALFSLYAVMTGQSLLTLIQHDQIPSGLTPLNIIIAIFILALAADPFKWIDFLKGEISFDFSKFESKPKFVEHIAFVDEFTEEFRQTIHLLAPKPLVVIIDDLDRCLPEKAIQVLEAIKVFLDFDRCVFLLALDRKMVERYVAFKYKDMMELDEKRFLFVQRGVFFYEDYLDKIIQMSIAVPHMGEDDIEGFIERLNVDDEDIDIKFCASIFRTLSPNPRKIKRALKTFLFVRDLIDEKDRPNIDLLMLAKHILLHYQYPYLYDMLTEKPGRLTQLEAYYGNETPEALASAVRKDAELEGIIKEADKHPGFRKIFEARDDDGNVVSFSSVTSQQYEKYVALVSRVPKVAPPLVQRSAVPVSEPTVQPPQSVWNMPFHRNPFFTGRRKLLETLHENFTSAKKQRQAISGLSGSGKTQIAVEYAYRYRNEYTCILWMNAADANALASDFAIAANLLHLPQRIIQNQELTIAAAKQWLNDHHGWLLILDDVEDIDMVSKFLPTGDGGHILITTGAQAVGPNFNLIRIEPIDKDEGILLLLRRAKLLAPDASLDAAAEQDKAQAAQIVEVMDGLPLALDQAAAYIEETKCSLTDYYNLYQKNSLELLQRRSSLRADHPEPVASSFLLSFAEVQRASDAAADLLRLTAFLAHDDIPEELITKGASYFEPPLRAIVTNPLELDKAFEALGRYSLLARDLDAKTMRIHRLVQAVLRDQMSREEQEGWARQVILAVNQAFPAEVKEATWATCEQYLPHALACQQLIAQYHFKTQEAADLLYRTGAYLFDRLQLEQAETLYNDAIAIQEEVLEPNHVDLARSLNGLALLYVAQGRETDAEPLYQRALTIRKASGKNSGEVAQSLHNLAGLYFSQGRYSDAEALYKQALDIHSQQPDGEQADMVVDYISLADTYRFWQKYPLARQYYETALDILENTVGTEHSSFVTTRNNLAALYEEQGQYDRAESLYKETLATCEKAPKPDYPNIASTLNNLARVYQKQKKYDEAMAYYQQAQAIYEQDQESDRFYWTTILNNRALLYQELGQYDKAEASYQEAIALFKLLLSDHPKLVDILDNLTALYEEQGHYNKAEANYKEALRILDSSEQIRKANYLLLAKTLDNYAKLLRKSGRAAEAEKQEARRKQVLEQYGGKKPAK
jgi:tetratricopeptide (TPR) repeat protein